MTVAEQLAQAEAELAKLEQAAPQAALRTHTGKAQDGDVEVLERLPQARRLVDELRLAMAAQEQAEADARAMQRYREDVARQRAVSQHAGSMRRAAEKFARNLAEAHMAFQDLVAAARSTQAALPASLRPFSFVDTTGPLSGRHFARLARAELTRLDRGADQPLLDMPAWTRDLEGPHGQIRTFLSVISEQIAGVKSRSAAHALPDPSASEPIPEAGPTSPASDGDGADAGAPTAVSVPAAEPRRQIGSGSPPPADDLGAVNLSSVPFVPKQADLHVVMQEEAEPEVHAVTHGWNVHGETGSPAPPRGLKTEVFPDV